MYIHKTGFLSWFLLPQEISMISSFLDCRHSSRCSYSASWPQTCEPQLSQPAASCQLWLPSACVYVFHENPLNLQVQTVLCVNLRFMVSPTKLAYAHTPALLASQGGFLASSLGMDSHRLPDHQPVYDQLWICGLESVFEISLFSLWSNQTLFLPQQRALQQSLS